METMNVSVTLVRAILTTLQNMSEQIYALSIGLLAISIAILSCLAMLFAILLRLGVIIGHLEDQATDIDQEVEDRLRASLDQHGLREPGAKPGSRLPSASDFDFDDPYRGHGGG
jgi:uncharacterized membrane protein